MQRYHLTATALALSASLIGCETTETTTAAEPTEAAATAINLPPAEQPIRRVGDTTTWRYSDGTELTLETTAIDDETASTKTNTGCRSKSMRGFGPFLEQYKCTEDADKATRTFTLTVTSQEGSMFPLTVGSNASWSYRSTNHKGGSWSGKRTCSVEGTATVTVPAGTFPTFHVVCKNQWARLEWHYAPELGTNVTYRRSARGSGRGKTRYAELVAFTSGT